MCGKIEGAVQVQAGIGYAQMLNGPLPLGTYQVVGTCDNCGGPVLRRPGLLLKNTDAKCGKCGCHPKFDGEYGPILAMVD